MACERRPALLSQVDLPPSLDFATGVRLTLRGWKSPAPRKHRGTYETHSFTAGMRDRGIHDRCAGA